LKLLFDQNLSPKLAGRLADLFPGSVRVLTLGLDWASDDEIWVHARDHDDVIVSTDADYDNMAVVRGFPPKILWLQTGNCSTAQVADLLRANHAAIEDFGRDPALSTLCLR
jgi:predicted nuclease of predicted toxin-antitoxin system